MELYDPKTIGLITCKYDMKPCNWIFSCIFCVRCKEDEKGASEVNEINELLSNIELAH